MGSPEGGKGASRGAGKGTGKGQVFGRAPKGPAGPPPLAKPAAKKRIVAYSGGEGLWRTVERVPGHIVEIHVPFTANAFVAIADASWKELLEEANQEGVVYQFLSTHSRGARHSQIVLRGRKSPGHPPGWKLLRIYATSRASIKRCFLRIADVASEIGVDFDWEEEEPEFFIADSMEDLLASHFSVVLGLCNYLYGCHLLHCTEGLFVCHAMSYTHGLCHAPLHDFRTRTPCQSVAGQTRWRLVPPPLLGLHHPHICTRRCLSRGPRCAPMQGSFCGAGGSG